MYLFSTFNICCSFSFTILALRVPLGPKNSCTISSSPSARIFSSTKLMDSPNRSVVKFKRIVRGRYESIPKITLLSTVRPKLYSSKNSVCS
uniref:Putative secreted peptide n=1 Tax=Anopheles braziliensis TaxID=58242 RepID=A0A2M3ZV47_9DIPT